MNPIDVIKPFLLNKGARENVPGKILKLFKSLKEQYGNAFLGRSKMFGYFTLVNRSSGLYPVWTEKRAEYARHPDVFVGTLRTETPQVSQTKKIHLHKKSRTDEEGSARLYIDSREIWNNLEGFLPGATVEIVADAPTNQIIIKLVKE